MARRRQVRSAKAGPAFGTLKQIDAGVLNVGYVETGPPTGAGRPAARLAVRHPHLRRRRAAAGGQGYRVIVPYLRGYGTTRFRSPRRVRNGQQSALAVDVIALMDALKIEQAVVGGCDWGARTANIVAALWPERCKAMVSVSGYLIGNREAEQPPLPPKAECQWWYQYYFATERGRGGLRQEPRASSRS